MGLLKQRKPWCCTLKTTHPARSSLLSSKGISTSRRERADQSVRASARPRSGRQLPRGSPAPPDGEVDPPSEREARAPALQLRAVSSHRHITPFHNYSKSFSLPVGPKETRPVGPPAQTPLAHVTGDGNPAGGAPARGMEEPPAPPASAHRPPPPSSLAPADLLGLQSRTPTSQSLLFAVNTQEPRRSDTNAHWFRWG